MVRRKSGVGFLFVLLAFAFVFFLFFFVSNDIETFDLDDFRDVCESDRYAQFIVMDGEGICVCADASVHKFVDYPFGWSGCE